MGNSSNYNQNQFPQGPRNGGPQGYNNFGGYNQWSHPPPPGYGGYQQYPNYGQNYGMQQGNMPYYRGPAPGPMPRMANPVSTDSAFF